MRDTALAARLLGVDQSGILLSGDLLGRFVDAFVVAQLRALLGADDQRWSRFHLRDRDGAHEIDVLLERPDGAVVAIEIKSAAGARHHDARHLEWLRAEIGTLFQLGIVFHSGAFAYPLGERIWALPIAALWNSSQDR